MFKFLKISCDFTAIQEILQIRNNSMRTQLGVTDLFLIFGVHQIQYFLLFLNISCIIYQLIIFNSRK